MKKVLEEYFFNLKKLNKISHSFIIGNTSLNTIFDELTKIFSNYIYEEKIILDNNSDIIIIKSDGLIINRDQIKEMQKKILTTSITHNKKIYIIDDCDKLNIKAANSLLKILEEPSENIYAFLITSNLDNVIPTIKSRCQCIFVSTENINNTITNINENDLDEAIKFIKLMEEKKEKTIAYYNTFSFVKDKEKAIQIFNIILYIYRDSINYLNYNKLNNFKENEIFKNIIEHNDLYGLSNKLLIINDIIAKLNYNLNINLLIDKFIIDFGGENI